MPRLDENTGKVKWYKSNGAKSVWASLISILIGLAVGTLVIIFVGMMKSDISMKGISEGIRLVFLGVFSTGRAGGELTFGFNPVNMGNMLFRATPLILTGLSVAVAFKTGLFNIGAPGQYLMGTMGTISVALTMANAGQPTWLCWICAFVVGIALGAIWGSIPGFFKALLNINEVITCIMTNWIAANLVTWWFDAHDVFKNAAEGGKVGYTIPLKNVGVVTPKMGMSELFPGSQANGGFWIACVIAIIMWVIMTKTTFGYELKACGMNRHAARYAGINDKKSIVLSMVIAGALASAAGSLYYLSGNTEFYWSTYMSLPAEGFNGIPVALLASNHPIGVIFAGLFMSVLDVAGTQLKYLTAYNEYIADIIIATIVYLSAFAMFIKQLLGGRNRKHVPEKNPEPVVKAVADAETEVAADAETAASVVDEKEEGGEK